MWVRLPTELGPTELHAYADTVAPVEQTIPGHQDSGGCWEGYFGIAIVKEQWTSIPSLAPILRAP